MTHRGRSRHRKGGGGVGTGCGEARRNQEKGGQDGGRKEGGGVSAEGIKRVEQGGKD